jgi:hypothetical protein
MRADIFISVVGLTLLALLALVVIASMFDSKRATECMEANIQIATIISAAGKDFRPVDCRL